MLLELLVSINDVGINEIQGLSEFGNAGSPAAAGERQSQSLVILSLTPF